MISIDENAAGQRIDNFLISYFKDVPRSRIYRLLRKGEVRINKKRAKPMQKLLVGDEVRIPPVKTQANEDKPISLPSARLRALIQDNILYKDERLLVINKPAGVAVHAGSGVGHGVIEILRAIYPKAPFLELVHRLDKGTSGCLLVAKSRPVLLAIQQLLKRRQVDKRYLLCVHGQWPKEVRRVDQSLQRIASQGGLRSMMESEEGKEAVTEFTVIQQYPEYTLLMAKPLTGRTHQIRVHAAHVGHPIVGDGRYGSRELDKRLGKPKRLFLHALSLSFILPGDSKPFSFKADADFDNGL